MQVSDELRAAVETVLSAMGTDPSLRLYVLAAVHAKTNRPDAIERLLEQESDKHAAWHVVDSGVKLALGTDAVFTQHGFARSLASLGDDGVLTIFQGISRFLAGLSERFGISCYFTSGTLLGLVRSNRVIAHDDDIDTAYVSAERCIINVALERIDIIRYVNSLSRHRADDHLAGLVHCYIPLDDGPMYRFDLFTSWIEDGFVAEYPLPRRLLPTEAVLPVRRATHYGVEVPIPAHPERLLEVNYGEGWRTPDPTFRFNWDAAGKAYGQTLAGFRWNGIHRMRAWLEIESRTVGCEAIEDDLREWTNALASASRSGGDLAVLWVPRSSAHGTGAGPVDLSRVDPATESFRFASGGGLLFLNAVCHHEGPADGFVDRLFGVAAPDLISTRVRGRLADGTLVLSLQESP